MQALTLIKRCPHIQVAHLYEHLFSTSLTRELFERGLYEFIDYTFEAHTLFGGFIYINLLVHDDQLQLLRQTTDSLPLAFDERSINIAIAQIVAEKELIASGQPDESLKELKILHLQPWVSYDNFIIEKADIQLNKDDAFYFTDEIAPTKKLYVTLKTILPLKKDELEIAPFYYTLSQAIAYAIRQPLTSLYGYYSFEQLSGVEGNGFELEEIYKADLSMIPALSEEMTTITRLLKDLEHGNFYKHIVDMLHNGLASDDHRIDELEVYKHTGVLIGKQGWRKIATLRNVNNYLSNTSLSCQYGEQEFKLPNLDHLLQGKP